MNYRFKLNLGFFLAISIPAIWIHLGSNAIMGEFWDGLLTALIFTVAFILGLWISSRGKNRGAQSSKAAIWKGLILGATFWAMLWLGWTYLLIPYFPGLQEGAFLVNCLFSMGLGILSPFLFSWIPSSLEYKA